MLIMKRPGSTVVHVLLLQVTCGCLSPFFGCSPLHQRVQRLAFDLVDVDAIDNRHCLEQTELSLEVDVVFRVSTAFCHVIPFVSQRRT